MSNFDVNSRNQHEKDIDLVFHSLFELLVSYILVGAVAIAFAYVAAELLMPFFREMFPNTKWINTIPFVITFLSILAISIIFDGKRGELRYAWLARVSRKYGYPIILVCALYAGASYNEYQEASSEDGMTVTAALSACNQSPNCLALARRLQGKDVPSSLNTYIDQRKRVGKSFLHALWTP